MIVEFIGSSGAGKTTLAKMVQRTAQTADPMIHAVDLIVDRPGRRWIKSPTAINLVADATALPLFLGTLGYNWDFAQFAFDRLRRHAPSAFAKLNYMRSIVRRIGMHELARRQAANATILADEGSVLTAYFLFVYNRAPFGRADLERFAQLVPLPDRIVYVRVPLGALVSRAIRRWDRRRELARDNRQEVQRWLARAQDVFEGLVVTAPIRDRLLIVDNAHSSPHGQLAVVSRIAAFISESSRADCLVSPPDTSSL